MKVTVTETVEHSADITPEMIEAYIKRNGWVVCYDGPLTTSWNQGSGTYTLTLDKNQGDTETCDLRRALETISWQEARQPHFVLAEIAGGT